MAIDLLSLEPNVVSRDLKGKLIAFYGAYKSGKTYNACKFPKPLLMAFEKGYGAISGVMAVPINKWSEFKNYLKQLEKPEMHNKFETIIVDTVDIAYSACEEFICQKNAVEKIGDIPYGAGYAELRKEFFSALRKVAMMDYGLVMISHSVDKTIQLEGGKTFVKTCSTLNDRAREIVFGMADIIGYAEVSKDEETGEEGIFLNMRETEKFEAGSRWKYTSPRIKFTYENLVNDLSDAIEREEKESGIKAIDEKASVYKEVNYDFDVVMKEVKEICNKLKATHADKITEIIENHLGKGKKISQCTKEQVDLVVLILDDLKDLK